MPRKPRPATLYAPSLSLTIDDFPLRFEASHATILRDIRAALGNIDQAYPYDLKRQPIECFKDFEAGKTVLVGTNYFEVPLAEKRGEVLDVQRGAAETAWMALTPTQRRTAILSHTSTTTKSSSSPTPPQIHLTLTLALAHTRLEALTTTPPHASSSLAIIETNWNVPLNAILGLQGMASPYGYPEEWDGRLLAALALLSECLVAQEGVARRLVLDRVAVRARKEGCGAVVRWEDVRDCLKGLFGRVG